MCLNIRHSVLAMTLLLAFALLPGLGSAQEDAVLIDDKAIAWDEPLIMQDGRLFVPVGQLARQMGGIVLWDANLMQVHLTTPYGDQLLFTIDHNIVYLNDTPYLMDVEPFISEERAYIPLRHAAQLFHSAIAWDQQLDVIRIESLPLYTAEDSETLEQIGEQFDVPVDLLRERNPELDEPLKAGDTVKVVIPDMMKDQTEITWTMLLLPHQYEEYMLLAKIIQVESGYESYEAQLAVGSVIMNRVNDARFPDSIRGVIYSPGQFPPATNGLLDKSEPRANALRAAQAVLSGEINVEGALYFYNPRVTSGSFWKSLTLVDEIDSHRFVK